MAISDFSECFTSTISIAPLNSWDGYSKPTYGVPVDYSARISERNVKVRNAQGEDVVADGDILLESSVVVPPESQVTLPDGSNPVIISVNRAYDDNGLHHTRLYFSTRGG